MYLEQPVLSNVWFVINNIFFFWLLNITISNKITIYLYYNVRIKGLVVAVL